MHISDRGVRLIAGFEGFSSAPYWDAYGGVWTRGFGETEGIGPGSPHISYDQGLRHLRSLIETRYEWAINGLHVPLSQAQFDALCSFVWNLGAGIFTGSLRAALLRRDWRAAGNIMLEYDHAGGVRLEGLTRRRRAEVALFLSDTQPARPVDKLAVLEPQERKAVNTWDHYERHPLLHRHGLRVTHDLLVRLRKAVWLAAERDIRAGKSPHEAWATRHRAARYRLLRSRTG